MTYGTHPTEQHLAEMAAMIDSFAAAITAADWDAFIEEYTEDTVLMPPHAPPLVGKAAVRSWAEAMPPITDFTGENHEVMLFGDVAVIRGRYQMSFTVPDAPEPIQDVGSFLEVRQRQADGRWLLARNVFNTDLPMPE